MVVNSIRTLGIQPVRGVTDPVELPTAYPLTHTHRFGRDTGQIRLQKEDHLLSAMYFSCCCCSLTDPCHPAIPSSPLHPPFPSHVRCQKIPVSRVQTDKSRLSRLPLPSLAGWLAGRPWIHSHAGRGGCRLAPYVTIE